MKVTVITNNIDSFSGWGVYSLAIVNGLKNLGLDLRVITEKKNMRPLTGAFSFFYNIYKIKKMSSSSDVVHAFDGWPYAVYAYFAVLGTNKKFFINGVGTYSVAPMGSFVKRFFLTLAYKRAQKIFCISNYTKRRILEKIKLDNLEVILLGKPQITGTSEEIIGKYKIRYNLIEKNYPIFLTVGAVKKRKGQLYTLKAISKIIKQYPDFRYFILGSGQDKIYVDSIKQYIEEKNISDNVLFINNADEEELLFFYSIADIFLLNSINDKEHFEGFGLVFLEAASFGLPVIGSKGCGIEDALFDGYNGYLAEQKNSEDIYEKIIKILEGDIKKIGENSKEFASRFSWENTVKEYYRYYKANG
ncbi:glycosyltransferase family 4 protein [Patescibacteria group bacterium]|nr:glycosyltransferase family 4 protein [Patescibacteria group bacterium]